MAESSSIPVRWGEFVVRACIQSIPAATTFRWNIQRPPSLISATRIREIGNLVLGRHGTTCKLVLQSSGLGTFHVYHTSKTFTTIDSARAASPDLDSYSSCTGHSLLTFSCIHCQRERERERERESEDLGCARKR